MSVTISSSGRPVSIGGFYMIDRRQFLAAAAAAAVCELEPKALASTGATADPAVDRLLGEVSRHCLLNIPTRLLSSGWMAERTPPCIESCPAAPSRRMKREPGPARTVSRGSRRSTRHGCEVWSGSTWRLCSTLTNWLTRATASAMAIMPC